MFSKIKITRFEYTDAERYKFPFVVDVVLGNLSDVRAEFYYPHGEILIPIFFRSYDIWLNNEKVKIFTYKDKCIDYDDYQDGDVIQIEHKLSVLKQLLPCDTKSLRDNIISDVSNNGDPSFRSKIDIIDDLCAKIKKNKLDIIKEAENAFENKISTESMKLLDNSTTSVLSCEQLDRLKGWTFKNDK
jgi:hypothetical protein